MISGKDLQKLAELSRLDIPKDDVPKLAEQLSKILDYAQIIQDVDVTDLKPTAHAVEVENVFRSDQVRDSAVTETVLQDAPEGDGEFFRVPKVI